MENPFEILNQKLDEIKQLITEKKSQKQDEDFLMTMEQLREYLPDKPARATVYGLVNYRKIPYQKHGKRLYFRKSEIDKWMNNGRKL